MHQEGDGSQDVREERPEGRPGPHPEGREGPGRVCRRRHARRRHVPPSGRLRGEAAALRFHSLPPGQ